jgi:hypothetical protein
MNAAGMACDLRQTLENQGDWPTTCHCDVNDADRLRVNPALDLTAPQAKKIF